MRTLLTLLAASLAATAAEDGWDKVMKLTSGTEIGIFKRAGKQPLTAQVDEAFAERILVVIKNEQVSIDKQDIDRIDYRPRKKGNVTSETKTTRDTESRPPTIVNRPGSTSTSSTVNIEGKPGFETLYRRIGAVK